MNSPNAFTVSVLLHKDGDAWVAQCLEYDLVAQGPSLDGAKQRFLNTLEQRILGDLADSVEPLSRLGQAPRRYFMDAVKTHQEGPELPVYVPAVLPSSRRVSASARFLTSTSAT